MRKPHLARTFPISLRKMLPLFLLQFPVQVEAVLTGTLSILFRTAIEYRGKNIPQRRCKLVKGVPYVSSLKTSAILPRRTLNLIYTVQRSDAIVLPQKKKTGRITPRRIDCHPKAVARIPGKGATSRIEWPPNLRFAVEGGFD